MRRLSILAMTVAMVSPALAQWPLSGTNPTSSVVSPPQPSTTTTIVDRFDHILPGATYCQLQVQANAPLTEDIKAYDAETEKVLLSLKAGDLLGSTICINAPDRHRMKVVETSISTFGMKEPK